MGSGRVVSLHRWPVKSMAGETLPALEVDGRGAIGDRARAVWDLRREKVLTAREAPRLLAWSARLEDGEAVVRGAGGEWPWGDPGLVPALAGDLGREVRLLHDDRGMPDLPGTVLLTTQATLEALPGWNDLRRFRTNIHVALDAPAYAEEGWQGRRLRVGAVELELLHPCERCVIPTRHPDTQVKDGTLLRWLTRERAGRFGINARVLCDGVVRGDDPVSLL